MRDSAVSRQRIWLTTALSRSSKGKGCFDLPGQARHLDDGVQLLPFQPNARKHHIESTNGPNLKSKDPDFPSWHITRPTIANERLKRNRAGQIVLQSKSLYKDGARPPPRTASRSNSKRFDPQAKPPHLAPLCGDSIY